MEIPIVFPVWYFGNSINLRTSWSNDNLGRRFFGCKKYGSGFQIARRCFIWFNPPLTPHSRIMLLGVLKKNHDNKGCKKEREKNVIDGVVICNFIVIVEMKNQLFFFFFGSMVWRTLVLLIDIGGDRVKCKKGLMACVKSMLSVICFM